jgi:hypothetical protein
MKLQTQWFLCSFKEGNCPSKSYFKKGDFFKIRVCKDSRLLPEIPYPLTPKPPSEHPGSAASQGNVTLWKVTGTQANSENKKNLQATTILKLLGRQVLSASEITFCGHLSEKPKWKFPGL